MDFKTRIWIAHSKSSLIVKLLCTQIRFLVCYPTVFAFLLSLFSLPLFGQENPPIRHYQITTLPSQLFFPEFQIIAEKYKGKYGAGLMVGYKPITHSAETESFVDLDFYSDYRWLTLGVQGKYFYNNKKRRYLEANIFVRQRQHKDYSDQLIYTRPSQPRYNYVLNNHIIAFRLFIGEQGYFKPGKSGTLCFETYGGIGVRAIFEQRKIQSFLQLREDIVRFEIVPRTIILPTVHFGVKVGYMCFKSSTKNRAN